jgi:7,8-dihydropterin-6-yl-methyl-4-(beta-D-ribofuranosyl)aminobenzene 5'-phosphate synthase
MIPAEALELTTLAENTAGQRGLLGEWGWSLLARCGERSFLLDTGAGPATATNAAALDADLRPVEAVALSHGHYDHTGGLPAMLEAIRAARGDAHRPEVPVHLHPDAWGPKYARNRKTGICRYVGIPWQRLEAERVGARFREASGPVELDRDVLLSGPVPRAFDFEEVADNLLLRDGEQFVQDPLEDDQALFLRTELGLIVLLGCAHRGVLSTVALGRRLTGLERVYLVLGGTHLHDAGAGRVERTIEGLREAGVEWLGVSHCTGAKAAVRLAQAFGERFFFNQAGTTLRFPLKPGSA